MTAPPGVDLVELAWATAVRPLARPLQVGPLVVTSREYCCVRATTASGAHGECFVLTRGLDVGGAIERLVAPRVLGAADRPAALAGLRVALRNVGWDGPISRAAGAVALAALDAEARAQGRPVWSLLGADVPPAHDAVVVLGYTPVGADPGETELADAVRAAEAGVRCVKLMGGFGGPERDLARVARLEQAVGDSCRVGLDVNGGWSRADAQEALPRLARDTIAFVEEPWPFELGLEGFDGLPAERPPLAVGEICSSVVELQAMAATGEVALLRADATLLGGAEPWLRAVELRRGARRRRLPALLGGGAPAPDGGLHAPRPGRDRRAGRRRVRAGRARGGPRGAVGRRDRRAAGRRVRVRAGLGRDRGRGGSAAGRARVSDMRRCIACRRWS